MTTFLHVVAPIAAVFLTAAAYLWHAHLQLRHGNQDQAAEVYTVAGIGNEAQAVHLLTVRSPREALELFRLLDEELGVCCSCWEPMWLSVGGFCPDKGAYCGDCGHPSCKASECDRDVAI